MVKVGCFALIAVFSVVFIDFMQLTFLFPLFPEIVMKIKNKSSPEDVSIEVGALGSLAALGEGIAAPYLGAWADKVGRRPVFIVAMVGSAICALITGLAKDSYVALLVARFVAGLCGGTASVAAAYISDVTEPHERASYMTYFQAALFGGLSFGPVIGTQVAKHFGYQWSCFASVIICLINVLMVFFFLPESRTKEDRAAVVADGADHGGLPCQAYFIFVANFLNGVGFTAFEALGVLFIQASFFPPELYPGINKLGENMNSVEATTFFGWVIAGVGVLGLIVNLFLYNRVVPYTGLKGAIIFGGSFSVASFFCMGIPISATWFFVWVELMVFGENFMGTSVQTIVTTVVHPSQFGKAFGMMTTFQNVSRALGPFIFSPLFKLNIGSVGMHKVWNGDKYHEQELVLWSHSLAFFINSFLKLFAILLCLSVKPNMSTDKPADGEAASSEEAQAQAQASSDIQRQVSRTVSGNYKTGGMITVARTASGAGRTTSGTGLLSQSFREASLQPIAGEKVAPTDSSKTWS